ncbi:MAG: YIP1 family protein [Acidobacteriia bacterium]|nr:YIP1 family protein [Terriglobia bacterium]
MLRKSARTPRFSFQRGVKMVKPRGWVAARTSTFFEVIHAPRSAFARDFDGPSYLLPLCILGLSFALLVLLQAPWSIEWAGRQMRAAGTPQDQVAAGVDLMWSTQRWAAAFMPLLLFLRWFLFALTLWLTSQLFLAKADFSRVLSVVAYSYIPILFRDTTLLLVLWLRGKEALNHPEALNIAIGFNLLMPRLPPAWSFLLGNINPFEFWYVILLTVGLSRVAATRWQRALAMTLPNWLFALFIQFGFVSLGLSARASLSQ